MKSSLGESSINKVPSFTFKSSCWLHLTSRIADDEGLTVATCGNHDKMYQNSEKHKVNPPGYGNELTTFLRYISPSGFTNNQARRESCKNSPKFQRLEQNLILFKFSCPRVKSWAGLQTYLLTLENKSCSLLVMSLISFMQLKCTSYELEL